MYFSKQTIFAQHFLMVATLLLVSGLLPATAHADAPKDFKAIYKAKYNGIPITATRSLKTLPGGDKLFTFEADSWIANFQESSQFTWQKDDRIVPKHYHYQREGLGRDRVAKLDFDWEHNTVTNDVERKVWKMEIPEFALDKLSYQLQLRSDLVNEKPLLEYNIADGGQLKQYRFELLGEENLVTQMGTFATVKVRRIRDREDDDKRYTVLWMAKNWDYLLVRLQQNDDGKSYEIDLSKATLDGEEVQGELDSD